MERTNRSGNSEYAIGDFARISRLSVKTLRYYHEIGLLAPTRIDPFSGYRYYDESCLSRACAILRLRQLEFSLADIQEILANATEDRDLMEAMQRKMEEIDARIRDAESVRERIAAFLRSESLPGMPEGQVQERDLAGTLVASMRFTGKYPEIGERMARLYQACGDLAAGKPLALYYDEGSMEDHADIEVCLPVVKERPAEGIGFRRLPGGRALTLLHGGAYEQLWRSYQVIVDALNQRGIIPLSPSREVYLRGADAILPCHPEECVTEIQFLVNG